ncbi:MUT7 Exonuclease, partial [Penelope pileata]|nr:MUT7 Exonuclease [Penelope pileata]
ATISPLPLFFSQMCNCNKYLKVPKERMRQLVEGSRHPPRDSCTSKRPEPRGGVPDQTRDAARPAGTAQDEQPEGTGLPGAAGVLIGGTALQLAAIPSGVLDKADLTDFYCCTGCGKVFWEGSHFGRVVSQFKDVLVTTEGEQSIHELS